MVLSTNGERVAFATWIDGKNLMVVNGKLGAPFDFVAFPPAMSEDGSVIAYAARLDTRQYCVINNRLGPPHREVGPPVISSDGTSVAHSAADESGAFVVFNGRPGPLFRWVGQPVLSPCGRLVAYTAEEDGSFVVVGDLPGPAFERVTQPAFAADGGTVIYGGRGKDGWNLMFGTRRVEVEENVVSVFAGSKAGCVVEDESGFRVLVEGEPPGHPYDEIRWPRVLADGRPAYFASKGVEKYLVAGEKELSLGRGAIWDPVFQEEEGLVRFDMKIGRELWRKEVVLPDPGREVDKGISRKQEGR